MSHILFNLSNSVFNILLLIELEAYWSHVDGVCSWCEYNSNRWSIILRNTRQVLKPGMNFLFDSYSFLKRCFKCDACIKRVDTAANRVRQRVRFVWKHKRRIGAFSFDSGKAQSHRCPRKDIYQRDANVYTVGQAVDVRVEQGQCGRER